EVDAARLVALRHFLLLRRHALALLAVEACLAVAMLHALALGHRRRLHTIALIVAGLALRTVAVGGAERVAAALLAALPCPAVGILTALLALPEHAQVVFAVRVVFLVGFAVLVVLALWPVRSW